MKAHKRIYANRWPYNPNASKYAMLQFLKSSRSVHLNDDKFKKDAKESYAYNNLSMRESDSKYFTDKKSAERYAKKLSKISGIAAYSADWYMFRTEAVADFAEDGYSVPTIVAMQGHNKKYYKVSVFYPKVKGCRDAYKDERKQFIVRLCDITCITCGAEIIADKDRLYGGIENNVFILGSRVEAICDECLKKETGFNAEAYPRNSKDEMALDFLKFVAKHQKETE